MKEIKEGNSVIVYLQNPREKIWGVLISLDERGVMLRGGNLESIQMFLENPEKEVESLFSTFFFPSHRIEKILLDEGSKGTSSIEEMILDKLKKPLEEILQ
jgi:hypothetical protein